MYIQADKERCEILAEYLVENQSTVRAVAAKFGVSKSTVHKDITEKICEINKPLFEEVKIILAKNKSERHIRGGEATKKKYTPEEERAVDCPCNKDSMQFQFNKSNIS